VPEALKNVYNKLFIDNLSGEFAVVHKAFDRNRFARTVFSTGWQQLELKARMRRISESLRECLPKDFRTSVNILVTVSANMQRTHHTGYEFMLFPDYIELCGQDHFDISIRALEQITLLASAEFAVRPFILRFPKKMMQVMYVWSKSDNEHIRRLASEGCRPRLPWAMALPGFKENPRPVLRILKRLKSDSSLYVRRSVANNLNDISKDHPALVIDLVKSWMGKNKDTDWLVKHACRGLLKNAYPDAMQLFSFGKVDHLKIRCFKLPEIVVFGNYLPYSFDVVSSTENIGNLRIEYALDFMKANGKTARKIFKISESNYLEAAKSISRRHVFKHISTRKHYPGKHGFAILLNGTQIVQKYFVLEFV